MKNLLMIGLLLSSSALVSSCSDDNTVNEDEITIERQEDYNREAPTEDEAIPLRRDNEVDIN